MANAFTTFLDDPRVKLIIENAFWNSWIMNGPFEVVNPGHAMHQGGSSIKFPIDYAETYNGGTFTIGTPMPDSDETSSVEAYFNKTYHQAAAKVYGIRKSQFGAGGMTVPFDQNQRAIEKATKNLVDSISTTEIAALSTMVDATTAFSDASLARATYSIASYEDAVSGALAVTDLEDAIEALEDVTYGVVKRENMVILMPRNQLTNLSRLVMGASNRIMNIDSSSSTAVDGGRTMRTQAFDGVEISVVPDMTTTEILIMDKTQVKVHVHDPLGVKEKDVAEYAEQYHLTMGVNIVSYDPKRCAKLTGVTA